MEVHRDDDDDQWEGDFGCADLGGDHRHHRDEQSVARKILAAHGDDASSAAAPHVEVISFLKPLQDPTSVRSAPWTLDVGGRSVNFLGTFL